MNEQGCHLYSLEASEHDTDEWQDCESETLSGQQKCSKKEKKRNGTTQLTSQFIENSSRKNAMMQRFSVCSEEQLEG